MLVAVVLYAITPAWAQYVEGSTTLPENGRPEHIYLMYNYVMQNGENCVVSTNTAPTRTSENVGLFAFYATGEENTYQIYNCMNQKWLTYVTADSYKNGTDFIKFTDNQYEAKAFVVNNYADNYYNIQPLKTDETADKYLNWYNGIYSNPLDGTTTLGLWQQDGAADAGSRWSFTEIPETIELEGQLYRQDVVNRTAELIANTTPYEGDFEIWASNYSTGYGAIGLDFTMIGIDDHAFNNCDNLTSVVIPETVTRIGDYAFYDCDALKSISIPASVTSIGPLAIFRCTGLTSIEVASGNSVYDSRENCNALIATADNCLIAGCQNTTIPNTVTRISDYAFDDCWNLECIEIPSSVTSIGTSAFSGTMLTNIVIPASVTHFGVNPFEYCHNLTTLRVAEENPVYDSRENCNAIIETASNTLIASSKNTVIPVSVTKLGQRSFSCYSKETIDIPSSVTCIGSHAFIGANLKNIAIPSSVTSIEVAAFFECDNLTCVEIPSSVTSIGSSAFHQCDALKSVTFQGTNPPAFLDSDIFSECPSLTTIYVPEGAASNYIGEPWSNYDVQEMNSRILVDGLYYNVDPATKTAEVAQYEEGAPYSGDIVIPANISAYGLDFAVTAIGEYAFVSLETLSSITIPNSVTYIAQEAFMSTGLTSVYIPASVTSIVQNPFRGCQDLVSIEVDSDNPVYDSRDNCNAIIKTATNTLITGCQTTVIPSSVTTIGILAFGDLEKLNTIEIPNSVTTIDIWAFLNTGLTSAYIPASVTSMGLNPFMSCQDLVSIEVDSENPVYDSRDNCNAIIETATNSLITGCHTTVIPSSVTRLEGSAFGHLYDLTHISVPASVTSIHEGAFGGCDYLESVTLFGVMPPAVESDNLIACLIGCHALTTIYVPRDITTNYNVSPWNNYTIVGIPTPEDGKYYVLKSAGEGERIAYVDGENVKLQADWTEITSGRQVWKACLTDDVVKFQNLYTEGFITTSPALYRSYTTSETGSEYVMTHLGNGSFLLSDNTYSSTYIYMHADKSYNQVVRWEGASNVQNAWEFVEVPADVVEELLAQKERNRTLEAKKYALTRHYFFGDSETFTDHGLIRNASFISTNKQETTEGPIADLLDGDVNTFFHSTWSTANTDDEFHYLQVDLGEAVNEFIIRFARRIGTTHNDAPKTVHVYATNDLTSDTWYEQFTLDLGYQTSAFGYDELIANIQSGSSEAYRYVRIVVEETNDGRTTNGNLFFSLSEFGIWDYYREAEFRESLTADEQAEIREAIADAKAELAAEAATQGTIDRLNAALKLISEIEVLTDGENFTNAVEKEASRITYSRNFKNTNWQPWYVPFEMEYDAISDNFDVARLNDVHQFDDNNDGEFERWALEIERLKSGDVIQANLPYMVRAKATGEAKFYVDDATLYPSESNSIDCSSTRVLYTFTGIYAPISGVDLRENGCYIMSSGKLLTPTVSTTLKPYRWYLQPEARAGYATFYAPKQILVFEKDEFGTTGIEGAVLDDESAISWPADVYDLNGRLVMKQATSLDALPKGVYMIGGVKIIK